ncbi:hypothetical protein HDU86_000248 [Geranomyces michiganensis]|nr:hypothetical protein HDU86_000248 [Geranomyces michiganensis]
MTTVGRSLSLFIAKIPGIYFLLVGKLGELKKSMGLANAEPANWLVVKAGKAVDLNDGLPDHRREFGNYQGSSLTVKALMVTERSELTKAENATHAWLHGAGEKVEPKARRQLKDGSTKDVHKWSEIFMPKFGLGHAELEKMHHDVAGVDSDKSFAEDAQQDFIEHNAPTHLAFNKCLLQSEEVPQSIVGACSRAEWSAMRKIFERRFLEHNTEHGGFGRSLWTHNMFAPYMSLICDAEITIKYDDATAYSKNRPDVWVTARGWRLARKSRACGRRRPK